MADVANTLPNWSTTSTSNGPSNSTTIGSGLDDNLQEIQGVMRRWLANKGASIASAGTTDLGAVEGLAHTITGTTAITNFGTVSQGIWKVVQFAGILTLTHNATSLILPGAASITTAAGDVAMLQSEGSGNWRCWSYSRASGLPIVSPTVNGPFSDATGISRNSSDATKIWRPRADNIATGTTRSLWLADEDSQAAADWFPKNLRIAVTVSSNRWVINLQDKNGATPSASNPIFIKFRSATAALGTYDVLNAGAASSGNQFIVGSGSTLGTLDGMPFRIYVAAINDSGTLRLGVYNPTNLNAASTTLRSLRPSWVGIFDDGLYSSVAGEDGAASDSAQVLYAGATATSKPIRIVGYIEGVQTTAGTWASAPTKVQMITPGTPRPGSVIGSVVDTQYVLQSTTSAIPFDQSIPQNTEGAQVLQCSLAAQSPANLLRCDWYFSAENSASIVIVGALFVGSEVDARMVGYNATFLADAPTQVCGSACLLANTSTLTTYSVRMGAASGTTVFIGNYNAGAPNELYGGAASYVQKGGLQISEVFV